MDRNQFRPLEKERIDQEAAAWVIKRDRGLSADEQDAYERWLAGDPRRGVRVAQHETTWQRFEGMAALSISMEGRCEPRALAPRASAPRWRVIGSVGALAALAALVLGLWLWFSASSAIEERRYYAREYQNHILDDGTIVEFNRGTRAHVRYTPDKRIVQLLGGEAYFHVAKDPQRPFVVQADEAVIRAVGTAFNVRLTNDSVEVLVAEGRVSLGQEGEAENGDDLPAYREMAADQRSSLSRGSHRGTAEVVAVSEAEKAQLLAWKPATLEFASTPLGEVVIAFNKRNEVQLVLADEGLETLPIEATFRSDNVEAFARLLELTFDIQASHRDGREIVLSRPE